MQAIMQAHKHNMQMHVASHFDFKGFFKVSLPALQVPANNQSMAASSLDPEVAFGPQKEWEHSPERPWVGPNALSLIPEGATEEQVIEAVELWGMPVEAWPKTGKKNEWNLDSYTLHKKGHPDIFVYLNRQVFTTKPQHEKHTYFSFWIDQPSETDELERYLDLLHQEPRYADCCDGEDHGPRRARDHVGPGHQGNLHKNPDQQFPPVLHEWMLLQESYQSTSAKIMMSTSADQLQDVLPDVEELMNESSPNQLPDVEELMNESSWHIQDDHQAPAQPDQLPDASFQLLDVDQIYLTHHNGGASIINAKKIGPDAKKKMVDGKEVIKLCDDGIHRVVWEVPMAGVDCEWQCC